MSCVSSRGSFERWGVLFLCMQQGWYQCFSQHAAWLVRGYLRHLEARRTNLSTIISTPQGHATFKFGQVGALGDVNAAADIARAYQGSINAWQTPRDYVCDLASISLLPNTQVDGSVCFYVDEIVAIFAALREHIAALIQQRLLKSNRALECALDRGGYSQNTSKHVVAPGNRSNYESHICHGFTNGGTVMVAMKYMGAMHQHSDHPSVERTARVHAFESGWAALGGVWHARVFERVNRLQ